MTTLIIGLLIWAFITLIGHGSWLVIRAVLGLFGSESGNSRQPNQRSESTPSPAKDMPAFERMIDALSATESISTSTAVQLKRSARRFVGIDVPSTKPIAERIVAESVVCTVTPPPIQSDSGIDPVSRSSPVPTRLPPAPQESSLEQLAAEQRPWEQPRPVPIPVTKPRHPAPAKQALSEVIASFLATHNIRWGELVAGLMIVVCSIGLVVSLWSTITSSHRVVPSLIFMSADAAIFAAGLYTMRRWRLRHTSRAVLIIATLLVPLSVLAGLAAAGASIDSVSLVSPTTLSAIGIGTLLCGWLLWQSAVVLVGRGRAVSLTLCVLVPTLCLPLLPAVARLFGANAGSFLLIPAIAVTVGLVLPLRPRVRSTTANGDPFKRTGRRYWKNHWLHLGTAMASLASVVIYAAYLYQSFGRPVWIQIAIATIPAWVCVAVVHASLARSLSGQHKWATARFICSVLAVLSVAVLLAILPASIEQVRWLAAHGISVSASIVLVSWLLVGRPRWVESGVPIGVAAMLTSPAWLAGVAWDDVAIWRTFLGGESLLVSLGLAAVGIVTWAGSRRFNSRDANAAAWVTAFWVGIAAVQAIVLSVAPAAWSGMMPAWGLACVLLAIMGSVAAASMIKPILAWGSTLASVSFWIVCLGLVTWSEKSILLDYEWVPFGLLGVATSTLALGIGIKVLGWKWGGLDSLPMTNITQSVSRFAESSAVFSCGIAGVLAVLAAFGRNNETIAIPDWATATWMIAAASGLLASASILVGNRSYLQIGMIFSAVSMFCGVTRYYGVEIWQTPAWRSGDPLWIAAGGLIATAIGWQGLRELARWIMNGPLMATDATDRDPAWSRRRMPDGAMMFATVSLLLVAAIWQYLAVLSAPLSDRFSVWVQIEKNADVQSIVQFLILGCLAACLAWCSHREPGRLFSRILGTVGAIAGLLVALTLSDRTTDGASDRLIATTTIACAGVLLAWLANHSVRRFGLLQSNASEYQSSIGASTIGLLVFLGSAVLIWADWSLPMSDELMPVRLSTLAVSVWWTLASMGLLFTSTKDTTSSKRVLSALLLPAAVAIIVPAFYSLPAIVWVHASVSGTLVWMAVAWFDETRSAGIGERDGIDAGVALSRVWIVSVGLVSAVAVLSGLLSAASWTVWWSLPGGAIVSLISLVVIAGLDGDRCNRCVPWTSIDRNSVFRVLPFLPTVMSGHAVVLSVAMGWIDVSGAILVIMTCGLIASLGSAIRVWLRSEPLQVGHVTFQSVALVGLVLLGWRNESNLPLYLEGWVSSISLAGLLIGAVALMRFVPVDQSKLGGRAVLVLPQVLGWFVVLAGLCMLGYHPRLSSGNVVTLAAAMGWTGGCVLLWRSDRLTSRGIRSGWRADIEASALLIAMLILGILMLSDVDRGRASVELPTAAAMGMIQCVIALLVAASAWMRPSVVTKRRLSMWTISMGLIAATAAVGAMSGSLLFDIPVQANWVIVILSSMGAMVITVGLLPWLESTRSRLERGLGETHFLDPDSDRSGGDPLGIAAEYVLFTLVLIAGVISFGLMTTGADANWIRLSIFGTAMAAWSLFQLSEQTRPADSPSANHRRHACVALGLWTLALFAVVGQPHATAFWLTASMRLVITFVFAVAAIMLIIPRLVGGPFLQRWQQAFRRGGFLSAGVAAASVVVMLALEVIHRRGDLGISDIGLPLVIVVAIILGGFALMAGGLAILSGPGFEKVLFENTLPTNWLRINDGRRRWLIYVAQGIAGVTWLHLFLCRSGIAFAGLRPFWPYIVMLIAFASVGLTQWAIRRKDDVLSGTMQKTAMFLPLIPIVGFWLSGSYATIFNSQAWSWTFHYGTASYAGLLIVGAIYYALMSVLWKRGFPRVATVVLANAALWVTLTQMPGWGFLAHPQAWLIPPAVCVLAVAYWQRDQLDGTTGTAIRYAATLVIYISSTADMLMGEIGSSLWGPVVLVGLSLAGMLAGVVLRIKPFLYLGTIFVFLGVTSMVWHAGQAIDAVWPWWVFGITSGLLLLSALAGIEKHRDQLQRWSTELSRWES